MSEFLDGKYGLIWYAGNPDVWAHLLQDIPCASGQSRCFTSVYELWAEEILDPAGQAKLVCIHVDTLNRDELAIFSCLAGRSGVTTVAVSAWPDNPKLLVAKELGASRTGDIQTVRNILLAMKIESKHLEKSNIEQLDEHGVSAGDSLPPQRNGNIEKKSPPVGGYPTLTADELQALSGSMQ